VAPQCSGSRRILRCPGGGIEAPLPDLETRRFEEPLSTYFYTLIHTSCVNALSTGWGLTVYGVCYHRAMALKQELATAQVRIYKKEHGVLRRLAFRKNTTIAEIIRQLIKG
jgi:hypothetical protein